MLFIRITRQQYGAILHALLRALFSLILYFSVISLSWALTTDNISISTFDIGKTHAMQADMAQAQHWQLSLKEWTHYKKLMQGPAAHWYSTLDPPEVLGLLAESEAERQHYAELVVQQRKARIDRELAFNRAVQAAWLKQYPQLNPVRSFDASAFSIKRRAQATSTSH